MRNIAKLAIAVPVLAFMTGCDLEEGLLKPVSANVQSWMGDYRFKVPLPSERIQQVAS
jgi:hypothetical protein